MKIIHYLNHGRRANGHVEVAVDIACEQARQNQEVHFVSGPSDFVDVLTRHGVTFHLVPEVFGATRPALMATKFFGVCRVVQPDIVNAHMVAAALAASFVRPLFKFKLVTTIHNSFDRQAVLMRVGNRVIAVSAAVAADMERKWVPARKIRVVRNGTIGGARRPFLPRSPKTLEHPSIATVAGIHPRKGIKDLLDAFEIAYASAPAAHLYLVGDGPYRSEYEERANAMNAAKHIHFLGHCDDPREILADADIFVLASLQEPFALVLGEARQMGCAIIATSVDGNAEALWQGKKGKLVPPSNPASLSTAILSFIQDPSERLAFSRAAKEDTEDIMVERMARDTLDVYRELLVRVERISVDKPADVDP